MFAHFFASQNSCLSHPFLPLRIKETIVHLVLEMVQRQIIGILTKGVLQLHTDEVQTWHASAAAS